MFPILARFFLAACASAAILTGCSSVQSPTATTGTYTTSPGMTMANFGLIANGMSVADVNGILGLQGTLSTSSGSGSSAFEIYQWTREGEFVVVSCGFIGGRLTSKTQSGLK